jgi:hypothetical protein
MFWSLNVTKALWQLRQSSVRQERYWEVALTLVHLLQLSPRPMKTVPAKTE